MSKKRKGTIAVLMSLMLFSVITAAQTPESAAELEEIQVTSMENRLQITLNLSGSINYESFSLFNPNRLVIDLLEVESFSNPQEIPVHDFGVIQIRTAKNQPDITRVVFDLEETAPAYSIEEKEGGITVYFEPAEEAEPVEIPAEKPEEEKVTPPAKVEKTEEEKPAEEEKPQPEIQKPTEMRRGPLPKSLAVSANGGLYMVQDENFREVYGQSAVSFGGDLTYYFPLSPQENIGASLDVRYITAAGKTTYTEEDVELTLIPFSLSLIYQRYFGRVGPYAGIGLDYINYTEAYPETFVVSEMTGSAIGYHFVLGTTVHFIKELGLKAFFKLHSAEKTINEMDVNFGGAELGLGLFYKFNF